MKEKLLPYINGLHTLPWLTDGAVGFLDSYIFYLKQHKARNPRVFEFGGGGSSLYFASRGCYTTTIEHDKSWCNSLMKMIEAMNYESVLKVFHEKRPYNSVYHRIAKNEEHDIILIDGRDRVACLKSIVKSEYSSNSVLILDNTERVEGKYKEYLSLLMNYSTIHFEQPFIFGSIRTNNESDEGIILNYPMPTNGLSAGVYRDRSGNSNKGRSITTIAIPKKLGEFTSQGIPLLQS